MPTLESCSQEIEDLHAFFVDWYDGILDEDAFARMSDAIGEDFEMVVPNGTLLDRRAVLAMVRDGYGKTAHEGFDIEIRNVEVVRDLGDRALVRYEEWQLTGEEGDERETRRQEGLGKGSRRASGASEPVSRDEDGRVSTVLLREADGTPEGLAWEYLHETAIEES